MSDVRHTMKVRTRLEIIGGLAALALFAGTAGALLVQALPGGSSSRPVSAQQAPVTHELMHQMMDAMHGAGTSDRMHEAMGADADRMIDQCVAMMNMMGMMGGQRGGSMRDMMDRMMGR
jgi:predicted metal-dependent peptidase